MWRHSSHVGLIAGKNALFIDKADRVIERVAQVEAALSPRHGGDAVVETLAPGFPSAGKDGLEVGNRKVDMLPIRLMIAAIAIGARVETGEDGPAAIEIVAAPGNTLARHAAVRTT